MTEGSSEKFTFVIFSLFKLFVALFVLKVICICAGFTGYIPGGDEVYAFMIKILLILGTGRNIMPTQF